MNSMRRVDISDKIISRLCAQNHLNECKRRHEDRQKYPDKKAFIELKEKFEDSIDKAFFQAYTYFIAKMPELSNDFLDEFKPYLDTLEKDVYLYLDALQEAIEGG